MGLHPSADERLQLKYDLRIAEKHYDCGHRRNRLDGALVHPGIGQVRILNGRLSPSQPTYVKGVDEPDGLRPEGPASSSHVRKGVEQRSLKKVSAEGAAQSFTRLSVGPSGLK